MENNSLPIVTTLNNGHTMPLISYGTFDVKDYTACIRNAIKIGYRCIDTGSFYKNEEEIGIAIKTCIEEKLIKREELFVITKIWNDEKEDPRKALTQSLKKLQLDYVDLYLIHWPVGTVKDKKLVKQVPLHVTWPILEGFVDEGLVKSIGVGNFNVQLLLDLLSYARIPPTCNEVELNPILTQEGLVKFCQQNKILLIAFNPIVQSSYANVKDNPDLDILNKEEVLAMAKKYNKKPTQIILNWHLYRRNCYIRRTSNYERLLENFTTFDFKMTDDEYKIISGFNKNKRFMPVSEDDVNELFGGIDQFA